MNQRKSVLPSSNAMSQRRVQPAGNQQPNKPAVVQKKSTMAAQAKKQPVAPPVYRPQPAAKAAQPKMASAEQSRNPSLTQTRRIQTANGALPAANAGTGQTRPAATPIQMKKAIGYGASSVLQRGGVIQRICGKCGSATHAKSSCTASADEIAAYKHGRITHGFHGKDRPKKHMEKADAKSKAAVAGKVNKSSKS